MSTESAIRLTHIPNWLREGIVYGFMAGAIYTGFRVESIYRVTSGVVRSMQNRVLEEQVFSDLKDAESGQRGYLLTGDENYLSQYIIGLSNVRSNLAVLRMYLSDKPEERDTVRQLAAAIETKLGELQATIAAYKQSGLPAALAIVKTGRGRDQTLRIRQIVDVLRAEERDRIRRLGSIF